MKMSVDMNEAEFARRMKAAAKRFGDTTEQGVVRYAVEGARALTGMTQVYGLRGGLLKSNRKKQNDKILADMKRAVWPLKSPKRRKTTVTGISPSGKVIRWPVKRYLTSAQDVDDWVEMRRTLRRGYVPKNLPKTEIATASTATFNKALRMRKQKAGIAKGGWIGGGKKAATFQRGGDRIAFGKNIASYAQKHASMGTAMLIKSSVKMAPAVVLVNRAKHVASSHVFRQSRVPRELKYAAIKTLTWYRRAAKRALDKK